MTTPTDYPALVRKLHASLQSWRKVAAFLEACGASHDGAYWQKMRNFGLQERIAICRAFVLPDAVETPHEAVDMFDIKYVISNSMPSDTIVLMYTEGRNIGKVVGVIENIAISEAVKTTEVSVTDGYIATRKRKQPDGYIYYLVDNIVAENEKTRKPTGKRKQAFERIEQAARLAALALGGE